MNSFRQFEIQPYLLGFPVGPAIRMNGTDVISAAERLFRVRLVRSGRLGQLKAYVTYLDDEHRSVRVRLYKH